MAPALPQSADTRSRLIADVVFDIPIDHAFSYVVPSGLVVARGQRVSAPLQGRARVGVVVGLREGDAAGLKPLQRAVEPVPVLSETGARAGTLGRRREPVVVGLDAAVAPAPAAARGRGRDGVAARRAGAGPAARAGALDGRPARGPARRGPRARARRRARHRARSRGGRALGAAARRAPARQRRLGGGAPPGLVRGRLRAQPGRGRHALRAARPAAPARAAGPDRRARSGPQAAGRAAAAFARPAAAARRARRQPPAPALRRAVGRELVARAGKAASSGRTPRPRPGPRSSPPTRAASSAIIR